MSAVGLQDRVTTLLTACVSVGGYRRALVATDRGLLIAEAGDGERSENIAALIALFDEVVSRSGRDLGMGDVDELTLLDGADGRLVIRPLRPGGGARVFVVVQLDRWGTWRRNTNRLCAALDGVLADLCSLGEF